MNVPGPHTPAEVAQSFDSLSRYLHARVTLREDFSTDILIPGTAHAQDTDGRPSDLAIMCAIDIATGMSSSMAPGSPGPTLTSDMSIDLLARPVAGDLRTVGRVIKMGRRIIMNEAVVTDSSGSTVAVATAGCAPVGGAPSELRIGGFRPGQTLDLSAPELAEQPLERVYDTTPDAVGADRPAPVASIALTRMTANPFGFLHGAVGAYLFLSGARRVGLQRIHSITVRYLRPTTDGPADVLVDETYRSAQSTGLRLTLRDRATAKVACAAHVVGTRAGD